jgi:hypothetical protein
MSAHKFVDYKYIYCSTSPTCFGLPAHFQDLALVFMLVSLKKTAKAEHAGEVEFTYFVCGIIRQPLISEWA